MLLQEIYISRVYYYWQDVITLIRLPYIFVILIGALCKTGHIARFMLFNLKVIYHTVRYFIFIFCSKINPKLVIPLVDFVLFHTLSRGKEGIKHQAVSVAALFTKSVKMLNELSNW